MEKCYSIAEVCRILRIRPEELKHYVESGVIQLVHKGGKQRIKESDVVKLQNEIESSVEETAIYEEIEDFGDDVEEYIEQETRKEEPEDLTDALENDEQVVEMDDKGETNIFSIKDTDKFPIKDVVNESESPITENVEDHEEKSKEPPASQKTDKIKEAFPITKALPLIKKKLEEKRATKKIEEKEIAEAEERERQKKEAELSEIEDSEEIEEIEEIEDKEEPEDAEILESEDNEEAEEAEIVVPVWDYERLSSHYKSEGRTLYLYSITFLIFNWVLFPIYLILRHDTPIYIWIAIGIVVSVINLHFFSLLRVQEKYAENSLSILKSVENAIPVHKGYFFPYAIEEKSFLIFINKIFKISWIALVHTLLWLLVSIILPLINKGRL